MGDTLLEAVGPPNKIAGGLPTVQIGWLKLNGTVRTINIPEDNASGCSGATDL